MLCFHTTHLQCYEMEIDAPKCQMDNNFHLNVNIKALNLAVLIPSVGGIAVSIAAFQAVDPGSTPGHRNYFL